MGRIRYVNVTAVIMLVASAGCRSHPQSWPSDPADLTGQVLEVRTRGGTLTTPAPDARGYGNATDARRLRIRVLSSRNDEYAPEAYIMVDGITQVAKFSDAPGSGGHPELEGAYVRVWLRSNSIKSPLSETPSTPRTTGAARMIAIDSVSAAPTR